MNVHEKYPDLPIPDYEKDYAALCATMHMLRSRDPLLFRDACIYFLSGDLIGAFQRPDLVEETSRKYCEIAHMTGSNKQSLSIRMQPRHPIYPEKVTT